MEKFMLGAVETRTRLVQQSALVWFGHILGTAMVFKYTVLAGGA